MADTAAACAQGPGTPPQYRKSWVEALNAAGFSVCGVDQQGTGFSQGLECYVDRFSDYVDDVLQFARHAYALAPRPPR
jgi:alpha-beta hydrolase superfamily lysophospholipase